MLILYSQYRSWIQNVIESARLIRKACAIANRIAKVNSSMKEHNGFRTGQRIKIYFIDNYFSSIHDLGDEFWKAEGVYEVDVHIIDILIEGDGFAVLAYPVNRKNMFGVSLNPYVKEVLQVDNMEFPIKGCLFAKYDEAKKAFFIRGETKHTNYMGLNSSVYLPKVFKIPKETLKRLRILVETNTIEFRLDNCHPHWYTFDYDEYIRQKDLRRRKALK